MTGSAVFSLPGLGDDADKVFDSVYPDRVRSHSKRHWTPWEVAKRAAELLVIDDTTRVLDVGSGVGKFCIVGALTTRGVFYGIEQHPYLVEVARAAATQYGARRTDFIHGDVTSIDWRAFSAFYLFNPFSEHTGGPFGMMDRKIAFSPALQERYVRFTRARLEAAPAGTRVATYHGYGGPMPAGFRRVRCEQKGSDFVELWVKEPTRSWVPPSSAFPNRASVA